MLQIGAAICMNKPICLIMLNGAQPPPKPFQIADKVIFATRETMDAATKEMGEYLKEWTEEQGE